MVTPLEGRILEERARMRGSADILRKRVEEHARGSRTREILDKTLRYESIGHLGFALFQTQRDRILV